MDWFKKLTGFTEGAYPQVRAKLEVDGNHLRSRVNERSWVVGTLETPTLAELRERARKAAGDLSGQLKVSIVSGDVRELHRSSASASALFQVASQFNLLEMTGPEVSPERGVTIYEYDPTQGPACAIAAGAATIYRNYFAPVAGQAGQTRDRQIDCLRDIGVALGNESESLWAMRNGYALCTATGLEEIDRKLHALGPDGVGDLRDRLRIGLHWQVEVTDTVAPGHLVSQAFCSALPVRYTRVPPQHWRSFATLVLEGAYEATLWAAVLNDHHHASRTVYLTRVGGGAFGNDAAWIDAAMRRALQRVDGIGLDVRIVSRHAPDAGLVRLAAEFT